MSSYQAFFNFSSPRTVLAIFAPNPGGLDTSDLCSISSIDSVFRAVDELFATKTVHPTRSPYIWESVCNETLEGRTIDVPYRPMFFANDMHTAVSSFRSSTKYRMANASSSTSPELKPRYAASNSGNSCLSLKICPICSH